MKVTELRAEISPALRAELQQTLADLARGIRDPEKMKASAERMDHMRERNRQRFGEQDLGVEIIREMRGGRWST
jgi:hypothetical protein